MCQIRGELFQVVFSYYPIVVWLQPHIYHHTHDGGTKLLVLL